MNNKANIPWVEKYRPANFNTIVLDPINQTLFENILNNNYFPNLLLYGPPGTGKTTTIINLINDYQVKNNQKNKGMVIHLNASDERGIDIIRNQIHQFVRSKNFFHSSGIKFVVLDEVDYMTKNAQQALKFLLQISYYNVRFCLICNYISKIDESLKNEFICIRFNQLPQKDIFSFIKKIIENENLQITDDVIHKIQELYKSDIRSMINFLQLNQNIQKWDSSIIDNQLWENIHILLIDETIDSIHPIIDFIQNISIQYNIDSKSIIKNYFNYIIKYKREYLNSNVLDCLEVIMHLTEYKNENLISYFILQLREIYMALNK